MTESKTPTPKTFDARWPTDADGDLLPELQNEVNLYLERNGRDQAACIAIYESERSRQLESELADLRHDIERHVKIASDLATELEAARKAVDEWPASSNTDNPHFEQAMAILERVVVAIDAAREMK